MHMLSGIACQECVCDDKHGRNRCVYCSSVYVFVCYTLEVALPAGKQLLV